MSDYSVDVDREAVSMDGAWFTAEELAAKVTEMLGAKDFRIGTAAAALEALQAALSDVRDIGFRLPGPMLEVLESTAGKEGRTTSAILRDALQAYLEGKGETAGPPVLGKSAVDGPAPAPADLSPQPASEGMSGGASGGNVTVESVSVSDAEAAAAVPLTPKKKEGDEESGWFGKK